MKKIIIALTLICAFISCKEEKADPVDNQQEEQPKVQLTKVKSTLLNRNQFKVSSSDFELIYDNTGKKLEKITEKYEIFTQFGQPSDSQSATYLIEYYPNNTVKSVQVVPDNSGKPYIPNVKFNFNYTGSLLTSYQREGSSAVSLKYDAIGNLIQRKAGNAESNYTYSNNMLTNSAGVSFEFAEFINPLTTLDKGLAMVLGAEMYFGGSEPVNIYSRCLVKVNDPGAATPNSPPSPSSDYIKVHQYKLNYPLRAEMVKYFALNPGYTLTTILDYQYKNL